MAYYDTMGNYTGYENAFFPVVPEETEEERRRRLAAQQPVTEKITYNADGTQKVTISGTPEALSAANPRTPTVVAPREAAPAAPVAPQGGMTPEQYNAYIAQNESRNNPNIGYHMPGKSSAFGTYGLTNAAYQDVQRADPQFANRPITSLNPQEQTQAQDVYTRQNTRYLQNYGVEPTQGNLALAHFLGAKGAADYIKTGTISQAAAAANGGEQRVREIAEQRLALGQAPVSGATQPAPAPVAPPAAPAPAPQPQMAPQTQGGVQIDDLGNKTVTTPTGETFVVGPDNQPLMNRGVAVEQMGAFGQDFIKNQSNPQGLLTIADDKSGRYTDFERQLARDQIVDNLRYQKMEKQGQQMAKDAIQNNDGRALAKILQDRGEGITAGGIAKAFLYSLIGFQSGAKDVVNKMGVGATWQQTRDQAGNSALIKVSADGLPLEGFDNTGAKLSTQQIANFMTGTGLGKGVSLSAEVYLDPKTGNRYRSGYDNRGNTALVNIAGGPAYSGDPKGLILQSLDTAKSRMDYDVISSYRKTYGNDILAALTQLRKDRPGITAEEERSFLDGYRFMQGPAGVGAPGAPMAAPAGAPTPVTTTPGAAVPPTAMPPAVAPAASTAVAPTAVAATPTPAPKPTPAGGPPVRGLDESETSFRQRVKDYERVQATTEDGRKKIVESASAILADQSKIIGDLNANKRNLKILESGRTNFGTIISGQIPGERAIGALLKTKDDINTRAVMEQVNKIAAANAKALGTNPTDRDLIFVTSNIPNESFSEKDVAEWIRRSDEGLRRTLDIAKKQVESGGTYIAPLPDAPVEGDAPTPGGAKAELEKRKKERKQ